MKINASLDFNIVAHEMSDEVNVLLELEAPAVVSQSARPQASLQVVLDRSGSMIGAPLEGAKAALIALVQRVEPSDNFGLVTFDDTAQVVVPAGPLTDKDAVIHQIKSVDDFASITAKAYSEKIVTSTLGYGKRYDETLLAAIARSGSGNHVFADNPDAAGAAIAGEVDGLLNKVVQALSLTINFEPAVEFIRLYNDLPAHQIADGSVMVELGDLYAEEMRKVLVTFKVPAMAALGLAKIATLELSYVELPGLIEHVVAQPITVNVVPGDEAAGRIPHPSVHSEVLFQKAQYTKRRASEAFEAGDVAAAKRRLSRTQRRLREALTIVPEAVRADVEAELAEVDRMEAMTDAYGSAYMSKLTRESYHRGSRKRGRPSRTDPRDESEDS